MPENGMVTGISATGLHGEDVARYFHGSLSCSGVSPVGAAGFSPSGEATRAGESARYGEKEPTGADPTTEPPAPPDLPLSRGATYGHGELYLTPEAAILAELQHPRYRGEFLAVWRIAETTGYLANTVRGALGRMERKGQVECDRPGPGARWRAVVGL